MKETIIISVITPSYNQGPFLAETIESVIGQEGNFSLDYLIIDGGSKDNSVEIIKKYENMIKEQRWDIKCKNITYRWLSEKDKGQADALAKGFRLAGGEILTWLNSDDTYLPGTLETVASCFRENPGTALLYGDAYYCDTSGGIVGRYPTEDFDLDKLAYFNFICQPSTFFRREAFEEVGGLDSTLHYAIDYDLFVRIGKRFDCRYLSQFLSTYRLHEESKTVQEESLLANHEEALRLTRKYYNWAPMNRVYGACYYWCLARMPHPITRFRLPIIAMALFCSLLRYLWLNRGLRLKDLKLLNSANVRKIFKERMEILQG